MNNFKLPNNELFMEHWTAWAAFSAITVADEIGLVSLLAKKPLSPIEAADALNLNRKGCTSLFNMLQVQGLLEYSDNRYKLTPESQTFLFNESKYYLGKYFETNRATENHSKVLNSLKRPNGKEAQRTPLGNMWEAGNVDETNAEHFTLLMHQMISAPAQTAVRCKAFDGVRRILDVGSGSGAVSVSFAEKDSSCYSTMFDVPNVCKIALRLAKNSPAADRVKAHPGNFFKDAWPADADAIVFSNIYHDWTPDICVDLTKKSFAALPKGGRIILHEVLLKPTPSSPKFAACFDLMMYVFYGAQQFELPALSEILTQGGFVDVKHEPAYGSYSIISARKP